MLSKYIKIIKLIKYIITNKDHDSLPTHKLALPNWSFVFISYRHLTAISKMMIRNKETKSPVKVTALMLLNISLLDSELTA